MSANNVGTWLNPGLCKLDALFFSVSGNTCKNGTNFKIQRIFSKRWLGLGLGDTVFKHIIFHFYLFALQNTAASVV